MDQFSIPADRSPDLVADIGFKPAFEVTLAYDPTHQEATPHGERIFKLITGGTVTGRIEGAVYPHGAGEYSLRREDGVTDVNAHILIQDQKGEWLYIRNMGFARADGYYRVTSWVDADVRSDHSWVLGLFFIGIAKPAANGALTISYYEVL